MVRLRLPSDSTEALELLALVSGPTAITVREPDLSDRELQRELLRLSNLYDLALRLVDATDMGLVHLAEFDKLRFLTIVPLRCEDPSVQSPLCPGPTITEVGLAHLTGMGWLERLDLSSVNLVGLGLSLLQQVGSLRVLRLKTVDDASLAEACHLSQLHELRLLYPRASAAGYAHLANLHSLREIRFGCVSNTVLPVQALRGLAELRVIEARSCGVTDEALLNLSALRELRRVNLRGNRITDAGLAAFRESVQLQSLDLEGTAVTDDGLLHLQAHRSLRRLRLQETRVGDVGLEHLSNLTELRHLDLENTRLTDAGMPFIRRMTRLRTLHLRNTEVSDAGMAHVAGLVDLRSLSLGLRVTDQGLVHLAGMVELRTLYADNTRITEAGLRHLVRLTHLHTFYWPDNMSAERVRRWLPHLAGPPAPRF